MCTCPFDNEPIYLQKYRLIQPSIVTVVFVVMNAHVYLMNENIDNSTFERYYLLNNIYGKIYNYNKNIKSIESPYYLLK